MLAVQHGEPFDSSDHLFEVKWDGIRAIAFFSGGRVRLQSRSLQDITDAFPDVRSQLSASVKADGVVLDGELVAPDEKGVPRLQRVMRRMQDPAEAISLFPANYEVFDIVYKDFQPLAREPLTLRKQQLRETVTPGESIHVCHYEEEHGIAFYDAATDLGLEGIVAKLKTGAYAAGRRSPDWSKVKVNKTAKVVIGGYTIGGGGKEILGSLLVGTFDGQGSLRFAGSVSGGFQRDDVGPLQVLMSGLHTDRCPFAVEPPMDRLLYWCEPLLVIEVRYGEVTGDGRLRFPVFKGLHMDVEPSDCTMSELMPEGDAA